MNNKNYNVCNVLIVGEMYSGELLKADFGMQNLNDESWYVVLRNGEVKEVKEVKEVE